MVEQKLRLLLREDVRESKRGIAIRVDAERLRQHLYENSSRLCAGSRTERAKRDVWSGRSAVRQRY